MNLSECFNTHFEILSIDSDELKQEAQSLRYQVYCLESSIFDAKDYPKALEWDDYDRHSAHRIIRHKTTGVVVGYVRLILSDPGNMDARFPIEEYCSPFFYEDAAKYLQTPRRSLSEISRFMVSKQRVRHVISETVNGGNNNIKQLFRIGGRRGQDNNNAPHTKEEGRREGDGNTAHPARRGGRRGGDSNTQSLPSRNDRRSASPGLVLGLFRAIAQMAVENNVACFFIGVESVLFRLLQWSDIRFTPIGPLVEYLCQRRPCYGSMAGILSHIQGRNHEVWEFLTEEGRLHAPEIRHIS